jgi:hypothetical protein
VLLRRAAWTLTLHYKQGMLMGLGAPGCPYRISGSRLWEFGRGKWMAGVACCLTVGLAGHAAGRGLSLDKPPPN